MMNLFQGMVDSKMFIETIAILLLVGYFIYKEWPEFKKRVSKDAVEEADHTAEKSEIAKDICEIKNDVAGLKKSVNEIQERQGRDFNRMIRLEKETERQSKAIADSLEERKMLMRGLIASLDGLEQLGCNHTVTDTKREINQYLNDIAHEN